MSARQDRHLTVEQDLALRFETAGAKPRLTRAEQRRRALADRANDLLENPHVRAAVDAAVEYQIRQAVERLTAAVPDPPGQLAAEGVGG